MHRSAIRANPAPRRSAVRAPSFFCVVSPVALTDPVLDPVLVHPPGSAPGWPARRPPPVGQPIGPTRALALEALEHPRTTTRLARLPRLTASAASRHATVLREAGLVDSLRRGNTVPHRPTSLGDALMDGALRAARAARGPRRR
ncbi:winged helix-turn-helix domain-containing protein [Streptomyces sp. NPDC056656]|uniref:winged helix-turn-helix domain-containing protein n=1 Tax=Streptomyces sp. NPDC056656 TaxID=3345895 RepID=UPI0036B6BDDD